MDYDDALKRHFRDNCRGLLPIPNFTINTIYQLLCYAKMGRHKDVFRAHGKMTVAQLVTEFGLESFVPLMNTTKGPSHQIKVGGVVEYEGERYRVIGRRKVKHVFIDEVREDFEVMTETLDGKANRFVDEDEVDSITEAADDGEGPKPSSF